MKKKKNVFRFLLLPVLFLLGIFVFSTEKVEAASLTSTWSTNTNSLFNQNAAITGQQSNQTDTSSLNTRGYAPSLCGGVQVTKYDCTTNKRLAGAQFTIYNNRNQAVQVIQSDSNGIAETRSLSNGYYSIRETKAPDGYQLESSAIQFSVFYGQVVCLKKANAPLPVQKGSLKITKMNEYGQVLTGAVFDVYNSSNQFIAKITTNASGIATLGNLPYGTYKLVEAKAPTGYELDTTPKYVTISQATPNRTACLTIYNKKTPTSKIKVVKKDECGGVLAGAEFDVFNANNQLVGQLKTGSNGVTELSNLPYGTYKIVETKAPIGYELDTTPKYVTISQATPNGIACLTIYNKKTPTSKIKVVKKDECGGVLAGAEFDVFNANNQLVGQLKTGLNGIAELSNLPYGTYKIVETKAPIGYELDATPKYVTVSQATPNGIACLTIYNKKTPTSKIKVVKKDECGGVLAGAEFDVFNANNQLVGQLKTGSNGVAELSNLPYGTYKIVETKAPAGYELDATPKYVTVSQTTPNGIACLTIYNKKTPTSKIKVVKKDELGNVLAGAEFDVFNANNQLVGQLKTGSNGVAELSNLPYGTYKIVETKAPAGYELDATPKYVTVSQTTPNGIACLTIYNKKVVETGSIEIVKKDEAGKLLPNAKFIVMNDNNVLVGIIDTDGNGVGSLTNLPYGTYKIVEAKAPEGYEIDPTPREVTISNVNNKVTIEIINKKILEPVTGSIKIVKYVKDSQPIVYLKDAVFMLYDENNQSKGRYTTDANGEILINDLEPGKYYLLEVEAPPGYEQDNTFYEVEVEAGKIVEVRHPNVETVKTGGLKIKKFALDIENEKTDEPVVGAEYKIIDAQNNEYTATTDEKGEIFFPSLPPGEVKIQETNVPPKYELDPTIVTETIEVGKIKEVTLYNKERQSRGQLAVYLSTNDPNRSLKDIEYQIVSVESQEVVTTAKTNFLGQFTIFLPVGEYEIVPTVKLASYTNPEQSFKVEQDKLTVVRIAI